MEEDISGKLFENWLASVEDIRDKISFQLNELFSFYEEMDGLREDGNQTLI